MIAKILFNTCIKACIYEGTWMACNMANKLFALLHMLTTFVLSEVSSLNMSISGETVTSQTFTILTVTTPTVTIQTS